MICKWVSQIVGFNRNFDKPNYEHTCQTCGRQSRLGAYWLSVKCDEKKVEIKKDEKTI